MNTRTESICTSIGPELSAAFWTNWVLMAMAGEIAGHALNHLYLHRSGRVIVVLMMCLVAMSILQGTIERLSRMMFWAAAFLLSLLGAVLARTTDISMGGGDIGAILLIAILLIFSFVICYRLTGILPGPTNSLNVRGFFWATATLAQAVASASANWITDLGGPPSRLAIAVIALSTTATIGFYVYTRVPRSVLFWFAFVLSGTGAALGGHVVMKSVDCGTRNPGASCRVRSVSLNPHHGALALSRNTAFSLHASNLTRSKPASRFVQWKSQDHPLCRGAGSGSGFGTTSAESGIISDG